MTAAFGIGIGRTADNFCRERLTLFRDRCMRRRVAFALRGNAVEQGLLLGRYRVVPAESAQLQALCDPQRRFHEPYRGGRLIPIADRVEE